MNGIELFYNYLLQVKKNKVLVCEYVKLAIARHDQYLLDDEMFFDEESADQSIKFMQLQKITKGKGAGNDIDIQPWQAFFMGSIFGWKWKKNSKRVYRYAYLEVAKKNGKTAMGAIIALYMLILDSEYNPEIYFAATAKDQAKIGFNECRLLCRMNPIYQGKVKVYKHYIESLLSKGGEIHKLSSDADSLDGKNPSYSCIDEFHVHKTDDVYNTMRMGSGQRDNSLTLVTTTAGVSADSPCYKLRNQLTEILEGKKDNKTYFVLIYTLDKEDISNYRDKKIWVKANPNLDITVSTDWIQSEMEVAEGSNTAMHYFLTKDLNIWQDSFTTWIDNEKYEANTKDYNIKDLKGNKCFAGLDLASVRDVTALALFFPDEKKTLQYYFVPEEQVLLRSKKEKSRYDDFVKDGWMIETPGNVTDYAYIREFLEFIKDKVDIQEIAYDEWNSSQIVIDLIDLGYPMTPFRQGYRSMSGPTKEYEKRILNKELYNNGNPVTAWMLSNVYLQQDPAGNVKVNKEKSVDKVDGIVADIMALGQAMNQKQDKPSVYSSRGIIRI